MELEQFGFNRELVLQGELPEFEEVANNKKEKRPTYLKEVVDSVMSAVFSDYAESLRDVNNLNAQIDDLNEQLDGSARNIQQANANATVKSQDDAKLKQAENLLADLNNMVVGLKSKRDEDARQMIELQNKLSQAENNPETRQLRDRVAELERIDAERDAEYEALAADVNAVLDGLEEQFSHLTVEA